MTTDVRKQLRELCSFIDDEQGPLNADEVISRSTAGRALQGTDPLSVAGLTKPGEAPELSPSVSSAEPEICEHCGAERQVFDLRYPRGSTAPAPPKRRSVVVVAVAAAIVLIGGVVFVTDGGDSQVSTDAVSRSPEDETVVPPAADPVPSVSVVDSLGYRWSSVPLGEAGLGGVDVGRVIAGGPGVVAVGNSGSDAAVWTSGNGLTWARVPHDEAVFGGADPLYMFDVTVGGPGLVAVGTVLTNGPDNWNVTDAVVWTSVDGLSWSKVPHDEAVFGGGVMSAVTVGGLGLGLVAVGEVRSGDDVDAAVWTSVDGISWSRVLDDKAVFGGPSNQGMLDITVGGPGFVAVGREGSGVWDNSGDQVAAVWTSVDGILWSRVAHDKDAFADSGNNPDGGAAQVMLNVTVGGPGLVAVGADWRPGYFGAVWTSVDGISWSRVPHDDDLFRGGLITGVTAVDSGLVAVGDGIWTSVDGFSWSRVGVGGGWAVTVGGPGLVAIGRKPMSQGPAASVWVAELEVQ